MRLHKLSIGIGIFYILSLVWDIGITFYNYQQDPIGFLVREGNQHLVASLKGGIPFFGASVIHLAIFSIYLYFLYIFYLQFKNYKGPLLFMMAGFLVSSILHIAGGFSWIV